MTTIFCKDFGKELWPQPTLTQPLQAVLSLEGLTALWDVASALPVPSEPGEVPYFQKHRHPGVPDSSDKQSHCCGSPNPARVCSTFASPGHLSQTWLYTFFSLCWLWPTNSCVIRCCWVSRGVWETMHTGTGMCKCGLLWTLSTVSLPEFF